MRWMSVGRRLAACLVCGQPNYRWDESAFAVQRMPILIASA